MFELDAKDFPCLGSLPGPLHAGAEIVGAVLSGHTRGRVFTAAPGALHTPFVYDNGFCVMAGAIPDPQFAATCLDWLYHEAPQEFFILYPGHAAWEPVLDRLAAADARKLPRTGFALDHRAFAARRTDAALPPGFSLVALDAQRLRQVADQQYPFMGGMWVSDAQFERDGIGFCVLCEGRAASLGYSVFVSRRRHDIDILTCDGFRRQGLARVIATAFIDACLQRGLEPGWDCFADNRASYALAQALGFSPIRGFSVYFWSRPHQPG